ncbi:MAG: hypothetical protein IJO15_06535, partial [Clostridia bacterium]|nr:hypothetical protein [Clostridia bacterium]
AYNEENYAITIRYKAEENVYSIIDTGDGGQFTITIEAPETIHTMAPEFLPEGYPYKEKGATILDVTHEFPALRQQQFPAENGGLEVGKVYTVTITDPTGNVTKEVAAVDELGEDLGLHCVKPISSLSAAARRAWPRR